MSGSGTLTPISDLTILPTRTFNTLAWQMLKVAECLKGLRYSRSTAAGTTTTLIDTGLDEPDDFFNKGTVFFLSGTLAYGTAVITDYDSATGTISFSSQDNAPGTGVYYAIADANYPREALVAAINGALSELGPYPEIYENATFITVADQESYTLPTGVYNVKKVFVATSTTSPYGWTENTGWMELGGSLYFDMEEPSESGYRIRLYYEKPHDTVIDDDDIISNAIDPDLLAWAAAYRAILTRMGIAENSEPFTKELLPFAQQKALQMQKHPIEHFRKASRPSGW